MHTCACGSGLRPELKYLPLSVRLFDCGCYGSKVMGFTCGSDAKELRNRMPGDELAFAFMEEACALEGRRMTRYDAMTSRTHLVTIPSNQLF